MNVRKSRVGAENLQEMDDLAELATSTIEIAVQLRELDRPFAAYLAEMLICEILEQLDDDRVEALHRECKRKGISVRAKLCP